MMAMMMGIAAVAAVGGWLYGRRMLEAEKEQCRREGFELAQHRLREMKGQVPESPGEWPVMRLPETKSESHPLRSVVAINRPAPELRAHGMTRIRERLAAFDREGKA
jgi:hypothetical protein